MARTVDLTKDVPIYSTQLKIMEMVTRYISEGYIYWSAGTIKRENVKEKVAEFIQHYAILDTKDQRYYKKKSGKANHVLVLFNPHFGSESEQCSLWYILLCTTGESIFFRAETYKNTERKGQRIDFNNYELSQYKNEFREEVSWSWRLNDKTFNNYKHCLIDSIKNAHHNNTKKLIFEISKLRGYNLVRQQYAELIRIAKKEFFIKHGRATNMETTLGIKIKDSISYFTFGKDIKNLTVGEYLRGTKPDKAKITQT